MAGEVCAPLQYFPRLVSVPPKGSRQAMLTMVEGCGLTSENQWGVSRLGGCSSGVGFEVALEKRWRRGLSVC